MKRYLLFAGDLYYPAGGWDDFIGSFDTIEECHIFGKNPSRDFDWYHVVDTTTMLILKDT